MCLPFATLEKRSRQTFGASTAHYSERRVVLPFGFRFMKWARPGVRLYCTSTVRLHPTLRQNAGLCCGWSGRGGDDVVKSVWKTAVRARTNSSHTYCVELDFPRWAIFLLVCHVRIFSPGVQGSRAGRANFITYRTFIFMQFINNRDVKPPSGFPNELQATQCRLHDRCVIHNNVAVVRWLTSLVGLVLSADSWSWCRPFTSSRSRWSLPYSVQIVSSRKSPDCHVLCFLSSSRSLLAWVAYVSLSALQLIVLSCVPLSLSSSVLISSSVFHRVFVPFCHGSAVLAFCFVLGVFYASPPVSPCQWVTISSVFANKLRCLSTNTSGSSLNPPFLTLTAFFSISKRHMAIQNVVCMYSITMKSSLDTLVNHQWWLSFRS